VLANIFNLLKFHINYVPIVQETSGLKLIEVQPPVPHVHNPKNFSSSKIQSTGILTLKSQILFLIVHENGSAVPTSNHQPNLPALKINPELPFKRLLPQFPFIVQNLILALQFQSHEAEKGKSGFGLPFFFLNPHAFKITELKIHILAY
jgi:hypothetical protein